MLKKILVILVVLCALGMALLSGIKLDAVLALPKAPKARNAQQISRIQRELAGKQTFDFAVLGDNKNSIKTFDLIINRINRDRNIKFVVDMGDLVFDGEDVKYRLFLQQLEALKVPLITAVGNHDTEAGGLARYLRMFGPRYYSFAAGDSYFVVLDNASGRRVDAAQMAWLQAELDKGQDYAHRFLFMHVPPFCGVRNATMPQSEFLKDRANAQEIKQLAVDYAVDYVFASHQHTYDIDMWPNRVHYFITGGGGAELWDVDVFRNRHHYVKVLVQRDNRVDFDDPTLKSRGSTFLYAYVEEPWVYTYAYAANNYLWLMPIAAGLFLLCLTCFLLVRRRARSNRAGV